MQCILIEAILRALLDYVGTRYGSIMIVFFDENSVNT